jgi:4'-phosphopantetheinyl transferase
MISWLLESTAAHPALAHGEAPPGLFHEREFERLDALVVEKRRRDWLLGRWTAKRLLQATLAEQWSIQVPLNALSIENDTDGAPYAMLHDGQHAVRLPGGLSISHRADVAFCAAHLPPTDRHTSHASVGADVERVEPRASAFIESYFCAAEAANIGGEDRASRDRLVAATWSGKEAVLKALHLGLRVDTRRVRCILRLITSPKVGWHPFDITVDPTLESQNGCSGQWLGWWRLPEDRPDLVLTIAAVGPRQGEVTRYAGCTSGRTR